MINIYLCGCEANQNSASQELAQCLDSLANFLSEVVLMLQATPFDTVLESGDHYPYISNGIHTHLVESNQLVKHQWHQENPVQLEGEEMISEGK